MMVSSPAKAALRTEALARRHAIAPDHARRFSQRLACVGCDFVLARNARMVAAFWPMGSEASPLALLEKLARHDVTTALPVTVGRGLPLLFRAWRPGDATFAGALNIQEPMPSAPLVEPDVLFVPLAAFDQAGHRVGYGAGHYDRTLEALRARMSICAIGVAYDVQEVPAIPHEAHDQPLDYVLTDSALITCRPDSSHAPSLYR